MLGAFIIIGTTSIFGSTEEEGRIYTTISAEVVDFLLSCSDREKQTIGWGLNFIKRRKCTHPEVKKIFYLCLIR